MASYRILISTVNCFGIIMWTDRQTDRITVVDLIKSKTHL